MINKKNKNDEDGLKPSITLKEVYIFVLFIFLLIASAMFYFRFSGYSPFAEMYKKVSIKEFNLNEYLTNYNKSTSTQVTEIKITEEQFAEIIGLNNTDFPLKKPKLTITPEGIKITGKTSNTFLGLGIEVLAEPYAISEQLNFRIKEIKAAGVVAPPKLTAEISPKFESLFNDISDQQQSLKVVDARAMVAFMMIEVAK